MAATVAGYTLIEIIIALMVFTAGALGLAASSGVGGLRDGQQRHQGARRPHRGQQDRPGKARQLSRFAREIMECPSGGNVELLKGQSVIGFGQPGATHATKGLTKGLPVSSHV